MLLGVFEKGGKKQQKLPIIKTRRVGNVNVDSSVRL